MADHRVKTISPHHMLSRRMQQRLIRHHVVLALATAAGMVATYALATSRNPVFRWSMATGYVGLALLGATLATGPLNVVRRRPNPVSTDLRRDMGIWAGTLAIGHFLIGWQVHMPHRYLYWLRETKGSGALVPRSDLFGFANYTGLGAVLVASLLLALSNDLLLRRLGTRRWKALQRWNYALFALVAAHSVAYQVIEKRQAPWIVAFATLATATSLVQYLGYRRQRLQRSPGGAGLEAGEGVA